MCVSVCMSLILFTYFIRVTNIGIFSDYTMFGEVDYNSTNKKYSSAHQCTNCRRIYKNSRSLWRHMRHECSVEPQFQCNLCGRKFRHKHHLQRHSMTRHNL